MTYLPIYKAVVVKDVGITSSFYEVQCSCQMTFKSVKTNLILNSLTSSLMYIAHCTQCTLCKP